MSDVKVLLPVESTPFEGVSPASAARLSAEATRWIAENRKAMDEYNEWYAKYGSPLDRFCSF